jgi:hypothetical protein
MSQTLHKTLVFEREIAAPAEDLPAGKLDIMKIKDNKLLGKLDELSPKWPSRRSARLRCGGTAALSGLLMMLGFGAVSDLDAKPVTVADLLAGSPAGDWRAPNPDDTLYVELARGRVVIELATQEAPQHVANLKTLVRNHYFDGLAIIRVQDNYVVQWADPDHRRPVPDGVRPAVEFTVDERAAPRFEPLPDRDPAGERCDRNVCGDRPCAAATRPQRCIVRSGVEGDGASIQPPARKRRDGVLCRLGIPGADHLNASRRGCPCGGAHADRDPSHRQRHIPLGARTTPEPA